MSLLTPAEVQDDFGGTGTFPITDVQLAIDISEFEIGSAIAIPLEPTTLEEEFIWPLDSGRRKLRMKKVTSITSVTAKHSLDNECIWVTDEECGVILNSDQGIIKIVACDLSLTDCGCSGDILPDRAVVVYIAGFTAAETAADTSVGKVLRMAITLRAREWLNALADGQAWEGENAITSWSSMDYSEQRQITELLNPLGPGAFSQAAWRLLKQLRPYGFVAITGPGRI